MITITGIGDRDRPEWMIRITGIRTLLNAHAIFGGVACSYGRSWLCERSACRKPMPLAAEGVILMASRHLPDRVELVVRPAPSGSAAAS